MPADRDVGAFDERAPGYDQGWLGRLHHDIAERTARLALAPGPSPPRRILDVGCGTGYLLGLLADRCPAAPLLCGVDPAPAMVGTARARAGGGDRRIEFALGVAESLPYGDGAFDLVVSTTSFDHWSDQAAGLAECARVLEPGGRLVLVDLFTWFLLPTLVAGHRGKARTRARAGRLLSEAGFRSVEWHALYRLVLKAATATRS